MRSLFTPIAWVWLLFCLTILTTNGVSAQTIRYVSPTGSGLGFSWADASNDLQRMINLSSPGDQVWVRIGTYYPNRDVTGSTTPANPRSRTFLIRSGVKVYGGFQGTETVLADRFPVSTTACILSGDLNLAGSTFDNAFHVVTFLGSNSNTRLDGFTIRDGYANGSTFGEQDGAGINCLFNTSGTPTTPMPVVNNCIIRNNIAIGNGGGMQVSSGARPSLISCRFEINTANGGGAVINYSGSEPVFTDCQFEANTANNGGAVYNSASSANFTTCRFRGNRANSVFGGAVGNGGTCRPVFRGCLFTHNECTIGSGGAVGTSGAGSGINASPSFINCTITNNLAQSGGGIWQGNAGTTTGTGQLTAVSTIVWDNTATSGTGPGIYNQGGSSPVLTYSDIQGCSAIPNCPFSNVDTDPLFVPGAADPVLQPFSPLINRGDLTATLSSTAIYPIDLRGLPRIIGGIIDVGAFEQQLTDGIFSVRNESWHNPVTWSCNCIPTRNDPVTLLNAVDMPFGGYTAYARNLRFGLYGRLNYRPASILQMGVRVHYVKPTANGTGDGTSWANASGDLQATLSAAQSGEEVWVQQGLYKPTTSTDRTASFSITSGVKVYGGFVGTETKLGERHANLTFPLTTTLSGNIGTEASNDNSYCVVQFLNAAAGTLLDGFVIQEAHTGSTSESPPAASGIQNRATSGQSSSPTVQHCHVTNNQGGYASGGLNNGGAGSGTVTLKNCLFNTNSGEHGGVILGPVNTATYTSSFTVIITNCTFANNSGIYGKVAKGCFLKISNSIFWGNNGPTVSAVFENYADGSRISHSTVQDGSGSSIYMAGTVSNADPRFISAGTDIRFLYHLRPDSPCINTGDPASLYSTNGFMDLQGNYRISRGQADQGCFEFFAYSYFYP